jgi:hypothetical protein
LCFAKAFATTGNGLLGRRGFGDDLPDEDVYGAILLPLEPLVLSAVPHGLAHLVGQRLNF